MRFPKAPQAYSAAEEARFREAVEAAVGKLLANGQSIEMWPETAIYMRDEDGERWKMTVSTTGTTIWTAA